MHIFEPLLQDNLAAKLLPKFDASLSPWKVEKVISSLRSNWEFTSAFVVRTT